MGDEGRDEEEEEHMSRDGCTTLDESGHPSRLLLPHPPSVMFTRPHVPEVAPRATLPRAGPRVQKFNARMDALFFQRFFFFSRVVRAKCVLRVETGAGAGGHSHFLQNVILDGGDVYASLGHDASLVGSEAGGSWGWRGHQLFLFFFKVFLRGVA